MKPEKRSLTIAGHQTSVSLEPTFWAALKQMADEQGQSVPDLIRTIDATERDASLSSTLRVHILNWALAR